MRSVVPRGYPRPRLYQRSGGVPGEYRLRGRGRSAAAHGDTAQVRPGGGRGDFLYDFGFERRSSWHGSRHPLPGVAGRLELRINRMPYLAPGERHERESEYRETHRPVDTRDTRESPLWGGARQGDCGEQIAPHPDQPGTSWVGKKQPAPADRCGQWARDPVREHRDHQHAEEVPQAPAVEPGGRRYIGPEDGKQTMAG